MILQNNIRFLTPQPCIKNIIGSEYAVYRGLIITIILSFTTSKYYTDKRSPDFFTVGNGVKQGSVLSAALCLH